VTSPADLRLGRWEEALADVESVDAVICDPPYGARTHEGHDEIKTMAEGREALTYSSWAPEDVSRFVSSWAQRCQGWFACMTSHDLIPAWERAYEAAGLYAFVPLPCVMSGMSVRMAGDGPSSWSVWLVVARPRKEPYSKWGTLPGAYTGKRGSEHIGGKPLWLMQAIVRDYTKKGDLICDPCAGGGTTLLAAAIEGRRAIGAEMDPETFEKARERLGRGFTPSLFQGAA